MRVAGGQLVDLLLERGALGGHGVNAGQQLVGRVFAHGVDVNAVEVLADMVGQVVQIGLQGLQHGLAEPSPKAVTAPAASKLPRRFM